MTISSVWLVRIIYRSGGGVKLNFKRSERVFYSGRQSHRVEKFMKAQEEYEQELYTEIREAYKAERH